MKSEDAQLRDGEIVHDERGDAANVSHACR